MTSHCIHGHSELYERCPECERIVREEYHAQGEHGVGGDTAWPWERMTTFAKDYWRERVARWRGLKSESAQVRVSEEPKA
jgi:hypothetical protein